MADASPMHDFDEDFDWDQRPPNNRRGGRQLALQALYWEASSSGACAVAVEELSRRFDLSQEVTDFASDLVGHVDIHQAELGAEIAAHATNWRQERIARIDGIILRLALAEILYQTDIPVRVSIDEAIELAKLFSTENSFGFVNGILDAVVRKRGLAV